MRFYFFLGDLLATGLSGALAAAACYTVFGPGWNMWLAMFAGMALGMAVSMAVSPVTGIWFGAFEQMLPAMTAGMAAGMAVSMLAVHGSLGFGEALALGVALGWAALGYSIALDWGLRGEVRR